MTCCRLITIGFSNHRPETLPLVATVMRKHETIVLEEPEIPGFEQMLLGDIAIEDYLFETDFEYPEFSRLSCELFRELQQSGKKLFQVDPFITRLNAIHDFFYAGGKPKDIKPSSPLFKVYNAERDYSAALLGYYEHCLTASFDEVVKLVKRFARVDAQRGWLRDRMRAQKIAELTPSCQSVYVEAGPLHVSLINHLNKRMTAEYRIRPVYPMASIVGPLTGKRQIFGPGDRLTLLYTYRPEYALPQADLLAAQNLVYTKIIIKDEMVGSENTFPHTKNEAQSLAMVQNLNYQECAKLYSLIKKRSTKEAIEIVRAYNDKVS